MLNLVVILDDIETNSVAAIPGMGIPEQLKAAMEQEQTGWCTHTQSQSIFIDIHCSHVYVIGWFFDN